MKKVAQTIFVALMLLGLFFLCRAHATLQEDVYNLGYTAALNQEQRAYFVRQITYHEQTAKAYLEKAQKCCWYLPTTADKDVAKYCFTSAMAMAAPGTPWTKIVSAILVGLTNYGLDVLDEVDDIQHNLREAEYHYEMAEFFEGVLING